MDPTIRAQLNKVEVVADPEIESLFPELQRVHVTIVTTDGREFSKQIDYPKGDPRNPLSDREIEEKFDALAGPVLSTDRAPPPGPRSLTRRPSTSRTSSRPPAVLSIQLRIAPRGSTSMR